MRINSTFGVLWAMAFCWLGSAGLTNAGIFNVRSAPYNAKGDGVTDDVRAIQSAIEAAVQAGPGNTVLLPAGNYYLLSPGVDRGFYFRIPPNAVNLTIAGEGTNAFLLSAGGHSPVHCGPLHQLQDPKLDGGFQDAECYPGKDHGCGCRPKDGDGLDGFGVRRAQRNYFHGGRKYAARSGSCRQGGTHSTGVNN